MQLNISSQQVKRSFTTDEIEKIVTSLGSSPSRSSSDGKALIFQTVCHNSSGEGSHKLYYYTDTFSFHCYTECGDSFDVYELVQRNRHCSFYQALLYIQNILGIVFERKAGVQSQLIDDWKIINKYKRKETKESLAVFQVIPDQILSLYQQATPVEWIKDHITAEVMRQYNIHFDVSRNEIIIPHYDADSRLIGIRSRSLNPEAVASGLKYFPTPLEKRDFRHTLRNNLYGLNFNKEAIQNCSKVMICEAEKSVMQSASYYGKNNFTVAVCGSYISLLQRDMILALGVKEVFLAFDKEYHEAYTEESDNYAEKILRLAALFTPYVVTYVLWDCEGLLGYKDSPTDHGKDILESLMKNKFEVSTDEIFY